MTFFHAFHAYGANVNISGVENKQVLENIQGHISNIDAPAYDYQVDAYKKQLLAKVQAATQVFGYYHVTTQINPGDKAIDTNWKMQIDLGKVTLIRQSAIKITGEGAQEPELSKLLTSFKLKTGMPLSHAAYESAKSQLNSVALSLGYFDFEFEQNTIQVFESLYVADINLRANSGNRYRFGELNFAKNTSAQRLAKDLSPFQTGDFYQASQLGLLNRRLKQTQYFNTVVVRPLVDESVDNIVPIEVILTHKPRDNFEVGAGVSSDVGGPRFTGKWRRPWVNDKGHALGAELYLSSPEQYISFDYKVPLEDALQNYLSYQAGYQAQDDNDTKSDKWSISATRHWTVKHSDWQRSAFIRLEQETFTQGVEEQQTTGLLTPGLTLSRLRSRGGLDVYWGDKQSITTEFASESLLSDINLVRVTAQSKWVRSYQQHRFIWRAELGGIVSNDFDQVPSSLRFFAGGDQSVRGFDYKTLSPSEIDSDGESQLTGGQYLAVTSLEYSYPVAENWRGAVFIDVGSASEEPLHDLATGVGIGAIWGSPIGPVRIYLARGNNDGGGHTRLHFSMGAAL